MHEARRAEPWLIGIAFVAVLAALVAAFTSLGGSPGAAQSPAQSPDQSSGQSSGQGAGAQGSPGCPAQELRLDAAPEMVPTLEAVLQDRRCGTIIVGAVPPAQVLGNVAAGTDIPDLWVPDSSTWLARLGPAGADITADVVVSSIASSPVVVASSGESAADTWSEVLSAPGFLAGDPLTDTTAAVPLLGARAEQQDQAAYAGLLVPVAQRYAGAPASSSRGQRLAEVAAAGGSTVVSEQAALAEGPDLALTAPRSGTAFLDYPVIVTGLRHRDAATGAATWLGEVLASTEGRARLGRSGFRAPDTEPLSERGIGSVVSMGIDPATVPETLRLWARLALPTRALAVIDVSGSMGFAAGNATRMQLTTTAAHAGVGLFPDAAAIGVWTFSQRLDGERDYLPMLPIRRLDAPVGSSDQRTALLGALDRIRFIPGTATGLYDTVLAAFKQVQASYDPAAVNSVILFTDGRNEDPGSIDLDELLTQLEDLQNPTRPVGVITIGISDDADAQALEKISAATGGTSYVARDPRDIAAVFRQALSARVP